MKKIIATALAFAMLAPMANAFDVGFSETLGETYENEYELASGLTYREIISDNSGTVQHSFIYEYESNLGVSLDVVFGDYVYGTDKLSDMIEYAETDGKYVLGGINGDFFSTKTGIPMGMMISDGILITNDDGSSSIGITANGGILVGSAEIGIFIENEYGKIPITYLNKYPSVYNSYLLTSEYSKSSKSTSASKEIIIEVGESKSRLGYCIDGIVREILTDVHDTIIPENCVVLSVNNQSEKYADFDSIEEGQHIKISFEAAEGWENAVFAIGGSDVIVQNSQVVFEAANEYHETVANPRTAVGVTSTGKLIFYAVDGRNSGMSTGQKIVSLAETMIELGCVYALNLDGGGSTTVAARLPGETTASLVNRPSDGAERKLGNAVLFFTTREATDIPYDLSVYPAGGLVLCGAELELKSVLRDTSYYTMDSDFSNSTVKYEVVSGDAEVYGNKLKVGDTSSDIEIRVSALVDGIEVAGNAKYRSIEVLDSLRFDYADNVKVSAGGNVQLNLIGYSGVVPVILASEQIQYSFVDDNGNDILYDGISISSDGVVSVADNVNAQQIKVKAKYVSADGSVELTNSAKIKILKKSELLLDFDKDYSYFESDTVSGGKHSSSGARLVGDKLYLTEPVQLDESVYSLSVWVKGEFSGTPYFECVDSKGKTYSVFYTAALDYSGISGWIKYEAVIPSNVVQPISLIMPFAVTGEADVIYDDVYANFGAEDSCIFTDMQGHWAADYVKDAYNMDIVNGEVYDGKFYYNPSRNITRQEFAVMLARFYNVDLAEYEDFSLELADADDIAAWALPYVKAIIGSGIMRGRDGGDGKTYFAPNDNISRTEAMFVFGQQLDESSRQEKDVKPMLDVILEYGNPLDNFSDSSSVATWAENYVGVCIGEGIVSGYDDNTIRGDNFITRAEAAVMLIRLYDAIK